MATVDTASELLALARDQIARSTSLIVRELSCDWDEGKLILRGQVPNEFCKRLAEVTVADVSYSVPVINEIEVGRSLRSPQRRGRRIAC